MKHYKNSNILISNTSETFFFDTKFFQTNMSHVRLYNLEVCCRNEVIDLQVILGLIDITAPLMIQRSKKPESDNLLCETEYYK